jgi:predicted deacylase
VTQTALRRLTLGPLATCLLVVLSVVVGGPDTVEPDGPAREVIGRSTDGWPIEAYRFGDGDVHVALIGGIHGGYEWNSALLAYQMIDYFTGHPGRIPASLSLTVVPVANPDGLGAVLGHTGPFAPAEIGVVPRDTRFNGNGVDLNRNWDCDWTPTGRWGVRVVSGGAAPFSEIETRILRDLITTEPMDAVIFWHSSVPGVYPGGCGGPTPAARTLAETYAAAAGYPQYESFSAYQITGDASNWLASQGIPAIIVELTNHWDTDWEQNLAGVWAVLGSLARRPYSSSSRPVMAPLVRFAFSARMRLSVVSASKMDQPSGYSIPFSAAQSTWPCTVMRRSPGP